MDISIVIYKEKAYMLGMGRDNYTLNFAGVADLAVAASPKPNFGFLSAGFNIWKEHIKVSSTLIMPPALSNSPQ